MSWKFLSAEKVAPDFPHPPRDKVKCIKFSSVVRYFSLSLFTFETVHYTKMNMFFLPDFFYSLFFFVPPFPVFSLSLSFSRRFSFLFFFLSPARNQLLRFLTVNFVKDRKHRQHFLSFWEVFSNRCQPPRLNLWRCISRTVSMKTFF